MTPYLLGVLLGWLTLGAGVIWWHHRVKHPDPPPMPAPQQIPSQAALDQHAAATKAIQEKTDAELVSDADREFAARGDGGKG